MSSEYTAEDIKRQEAELIFDSFTPLDAWKLGSIITEAAVAAEATVAIDIRRGNRILFRSMLPGTTVDQEFWIGGKAALAQRFECSSALTAFRMAGANSEQMTRHGLDPRDYALAGGSFPIRVRGAGIVAVATASGLTDADDHLLIVSGIESYLGTSR
ncbi:heme-degrading domain-containing protein (plasmid) [Coraliomargarita sp. W4R53]